MESYISLDVCGSYSIYVASDKHTPKIDDDICWMDGVCVLVVVVKIYTAFILRAT